jgi:hypothetical protein
VLFIYITRLASNEIFSLLNKIDRDVGRAKDLSAPRYTIGHGLDGLEAGFGISVRVTVSYLSCSA